MAASFVHPPEAVAGQPSGSLTVILHAVESVSCEGLVLAVSRPQRRADWNARPGARADAPRPACPIRQLAIRVRLMELRERLHQAFRCESLIGTGPAITSARAGSPRGCQHHGRAHRGRTRNRQATGGSNHSPPGVRASSSARANRLRGPPRRGHRARTLRFPTRGSARRQCAEFRTGTFPRLPLTGRGLEFLIGDILALPRDLQRGSPSRSTAGCG